MPSSITPTDFDVRSVSSSMSDGKNPALDALVNLPMVGKDTKEELPSAGMTCDIKDLWEGESKCTCCVNWLEEYPVDVKPNPEETEAVQRYALVLKHRKSHGSSDKPMPVDTIVVQSPLLKPILEEVFEGYEGITATLKKVTFTKPFEPFFYRWSRFQKVVKSQEDEATRAHAQLLYDVLLNELDETVNTYHDLLSHGVITYKYLWALFRPGDLILRELNGQEMIMKLQTSIDTGMATTFIGKYVDWNGFTFGYATKTFNLPHFEGTKAITDLPIYPIQFNPEGSAIKHRLAARGQRFAELQGYHYKNYKGFAQLVVPPLSSRTQRNPCLRNVEGRIIVDAGMYSRFSGEPVEPLQPLGSVSFTPVIPPPVENVHIPDNIPDNMNHQIPPPPPPPPAFVSATQMHMTLTDDLYPICSPFVKGYSLKTKSWARFSVDCVQEISWDDRAFDGLVLPPGYKDLILSFTKNQNSTEDLLDDVIEGKGQGIVMLLTGESGVGKTLTAESVSEHMRVPLYSMSAAQLGTRSDTVEQSLGDILEMVTKWKAILLLDETEVFLEQRSIDSLERNKLVSIFLRMLEYYRGVLFLTTNRVAAIDKAIESRIHLKIVYPELDRSARLRIWNNLISLLPPATNGLDSADLDTLSQRSMNGREIKNVIKAAQLLASGQGTALALEHVYTVLRITQIGVGTGSQV